MTETKNIAVLFDFDGVVVDTETQYSIFWHKMGVDYLGMEDLESRVKGQTLVYIYNTFFPGMIKEQEEITAGLDRFEQEMTFEFIPGVESFIADLRRNGVAFCTLVSAGGSTISSIRLGQKDLDGATEVLGNTLMFCLINAVVFGGLAFLFLDEILRFFGASQDTLPYARDFMQIILAGTPITYTMIGLNNIMRATGYPKKAMLTSMVTVVCNIILAPIFIFHFDWGIRGAATATVISQFIGMVWVVKHFLDKDSFVRFRPDFWKLKKRIISSIFSIGMSPFLMNVCACVIVIIINNSLQRHGGDMAIGAYGIINRLLTLYIMIVLGLTMGMQPIVGYNFGAQKHDRVKQTLKLSILTGVCITSSGFLICELFPHAVSAIFTNDQELIDIASRGVRICVLMFPLVGAQIVIGNFFQSIGKAKISIFLSLTRQLLYLLPGLIFFPRFIGLDGIWTSMPVADFFAFLTALVVLWTYIRKKNKESFA